MNIRFVNIRFGHLRPLAAGTLAFVLVQSVQAAPVEEVTVTARRLEESIPVELEKAGSRLTTLPAEFIANGVYNDIGQTLSGTVPGLFVAPSSGPFSYVDASLQGSRSGDILWLVDGVRINNRLYTSTLPLDTLPAHMVERIEVLEGGQGLFYGTQAIAGVINVVTKEATDRPSVTLSSGFHTNDGYSVSGNFRGTFAGKHRLVVYGSKDEADGIPPYRDGDFQPSATDRDRSYDVRVGGLRYAIDFTDDARLSISYQHTEADLDQLSPMRVHKAINSRNEEIASAKFDYRINDNVELYLKGYYHDWDTSYVTLWNSLTTPGAIEVVYPPGTYWGFDDKGLNAMVRIKQAAGLEYFVGYDLQRYGGRDDVLLIAPNSEETHAVFAQVRTTPALLANTVLSAGARYNSPSDARDVTVWTVTGRHDFSANLFVRGVAGTGMRLPSAEELYAIDPFERGNPNLKPETSKNLNLSIGGTIPLNDMRQLDWELIGFRREVDDLIQWVYDEEEDLDIATNVPGTVEFTGGTLALNANLTSELSLRASYTYTKSEREGSNRQLDRVPKSSAQATLDYSPAALPFGATLNINYVGSVTNTIFSGTRDYGHYSVVDAAFRYFLGEARKHRLDLRIENVFDEEHGRPATARTDVGNAPYEVVQLGVPRTAHLRYTYAF